MFCIRLFECHMYNAKCDCTPTWQWFSGRNLRDQLACAAANHHQGPL